MSREPAAPVCLTCRSTVLTQLNPPCSAVGLQCRSYGVDMLVIFGLIIVVAAVVVGAAGVLGNEGGAHGAAHGFSVLGYHVNGSGTVFLYGIAVGAVGLFGLWLLLACAAYRPPRQRGTARSPAVPPRDRPVPPGNRRCQQGPRRPHRPARHRPRRHRQRAGQPRAGQPQWPQRGPGPSGEPGQAPPDQAAPVRPLGRCRLAGLDMLQAAAADPEPLAAQAPADAPAGAPSPAAGSR